MDELSDQEFESMLADAELATCIANAEKAQYEAEAAKVALERAKVELLQEQVNVDYTLSGVFVFNRGVNQRSQNALMKSMRVWHQHDPEGKWTIYLNSVGGSVFAGNGILDEIAAHSVRGGGTHEIEIKVRGVAASMAAMILQAADVRTVGKYSQLMIHKGTTGAHGPQEMLEDEITWMRESTDWMIRLFIERGCTLSRPEILRKMNRRDWWISSDEAVKLGLADRVG